VRTVPALAFTPVAYGRFAPQADVSANKMLCPARMSAMTGRAAAFEVVANVGKGSGFSDATRNVWVTRIVAWRRRSAQAGNRGVGLGGPFVAMGIWAVGLPWI